MSQVADKYHCRGRRRRSSSSYFIVLFIDFFFLPSQELFCFRSNANAWNFIHIWVKVSSIFNHLHILNQIVKYNLTMGFFCHTEFFFSVVICVYFEQVTMDKCFFRLSYVCSLSFDSCAHHSLLSGWSCSLMKSNWLQTRWFICCSLLANPFQRTRLNLWFIPSICTYIRLTHSKQPYQTIYVNLQCVFDAGFVCSVVCNFIFWASVWMKKISVTNIQSVEIQLARDVTDGRHAHQILC